MEGAPMRYVEDIGTQGDYIERKFKDKSKNISKKNFENTQHSSLKN